VSVAVKVGGEGLGVIVEVGIYGSGFNFHKKPWTLNDQ